jgi:hypothetical protein
MYIAMKTYIKLVLVLTLLLVLGVSLCKRLTFFLLVHAYQSVFLPTRNWYEYLEKQYHDVSNIYT